MTAPTWCDNRLTLVTRVGPLTTVFTPPPGCTGNPQFHLDDATSVSPIPPYGLFHIGYVDRPSTCEPSWNSAWTNGYPVQTVYFYSPGVCPQGYTTAIHSPRLDCLAEKLRPSETLILCCPTGYWADPKLDEAWNICTSTFTTPKLLTIEWGSGTNRGPLITATVTPTTELALYDNPHLIIVTGTSQAGGAGGGAGAADTLSDSDSSSSGMSKDAKIAIGVAIPLVVIAIAAAIGFYIFFRRRLAKKPAAGEAPVPVTFTGKPELEGTAIASVGKRDEDSKPGLGQPGIDKPELDSTAPAEPPVPELSNQPLEYELAATSGPLYEMPPGIPAVPELEGNAYRRKPV